MEFEGVDAEEQPNAAVELLGQVEVLLGRLAEALRLLALRAQQRALQLAVMLCLQVLLLWVAGFLYGSFYYTFMPRPSYSTPVHFYYRADCQLPAVCSFPMANVSLLSKGRDHVMTYGQPYRISLELEMPESPANQNLGMFMVKMTTYGKDDRTIRTSARTSMLHYRSSLLQSMSTVLLSPLLLTGASEQEQLVSIELFSDYIEDTYVPTAGAVIELRSQQVQVYSAHLFIHAHFTGIRYVLFNFPVLSAVGGVASAFLFLSIIILIGSVKNSLNTQISGSRVRQHHQMRNTRGNSPLSSDPSDITAGQWESCQGGHIIKKGKEKASHLTNPPSRSNDPTVEACNVMEESIPEGAGETELKPMKGGSIHTGVSHPNRDAATEDDQQMAHRNETKIEGSSATPEPLSPSEEQPSTDCVVS
ncbi:seipin-like isoform X2 [Engraulis encrasicolus]|uniref:seipin-like isoform X2 n=1 Tax=Engraulis encrasicolus TaxID=184585 RepID=UPI002FD67820